MKLVQVRECDGKCCEEKPRWPNADGSHCRFWNKGCVLMRGEAEVPEVSHAKPDWPGQRTFQETCVDWPHNTHPGKDTGGCCWQWIEDDD